jgi:aspartyl-tRNA(Asn)/glutamyl-tRNA(Gln) amidotransferase subunit C
MINAETIKKLAELARLKVADSELDFYTQQLNNILSLEEKLQALKTDIKPLFHSLDVPQRLRPDVITEANQRELMQSIAPKSLAGLYLVPKVIE